MSVFVFGSNLAGRHGAGAAKYAKEHFGAIQGQGRGRQGNSYAIPTKDAKLEPLSLDDIQENVLQFLDYARTHSNTEFVVTRIGCGLAGYSNFDIAPMFKNYPPNCDLDTAWRVILDSSE